jgi:hypothetical protein
MNRTALMTYLAAAVALTLAAGGPLRAAGLVFDYDANLGWEGGRSTAPFLFVDVAGSEDFTAEVTIGAQTSGNWSDAGIIVRAKQGTPPGADADNADEHFTFLGSFRTNAANPAAGTTLHKRIEAGAQVQDSNIQIVNPGNEPLPIRLRLVKNGSDYEGWVSPDNGTTWQLQSTATPTAGSPLDDSSITKEVGLSFSSFDPGLMGSATFEDFTLKLNSGHLFANDFSTPFDYSGGAVQGIWDGSYNMANLGAGGKVAVIPEPCSLVLAALAAVGLTMRKRRQLRAA